MVKAKDFWNYLCEDLDYRFFAGVACKGLDPLYNTMSSDFMHYVPAANERTALGLVSGAYVAGLKGGLLLDMMFAYDLSTSLMLNVGYRIPFLTIGYSDQEEACLPYDFPSARITTKSYKSALKKVTSEMKSKSVPGLAIIGKGVLS